MGGVWGCIACAIFDTNLGFVSDSPLVAEYFGLQVYGVICISLWGISCGLLFFIPCQMIGWHKYHPVIEMLGVQRFKMNEFTKKFLDERYNESSGYGDESPKNVKAKDSIN